MMLLADREAASLGDLRYNRCKIVFIEQNHQGLDVWMQGFDKLRISKIFDMFGDPFERGRFVLLL
jgi:hypothetical protein